MASKNTEIGNQDFNQILGLAAEHGKDSLSGHQIRILQEGFNEQAKMIDDSPEEIPLTDLEAGYNQAAYDEKEDSAIDEENSYENMNPEYFDTVLASGDDEAIDKLLSSEDDAVIQHMDEAMDRAGWSKSIENEPRIAPAAEKPVSLEQPKASRSPASTPPDEISLDAEPPEEIDLSNDNPSMKNLLAQTETRQGFDEVGMHLQSEEESRKSAVEAWNAAGRTLHGALKGVEPIVVPLKYAAEGYKLMLGGAPSPVKKTWLKNYPDASFVDVFQLSADKLFGTDEEMMKKAIDSGVPAYEAARKVAMKAGVVYGLGSAADLVFDPTMYLGVGGLSKGNQKLLQAGLNAERGGAIVSVRNPITGQIRASLDSAPITSRVARVASKAYDAAPPKVQEFVAGAANAATSAKNLARKFIPETGDNEVDSTLSMTLNSNYNTENILSLEFDNARVKRGIVSGSPEDTLNTIVAESTPNWTPNFKGVQEKEFKTPVEGFKQGEDQKLYHGTPRKYEQYDFEKTGGLKFYAEEPGRAYPYATTNSGSNRQRGMKDSDFFTIDHSQSQAHGVVYEFDSDKGIWKATAVASDGSLPGSFKPIPPGEKYPNKTMDDFRDLHEEESWQVEQVSKTAKVEEQKFSGLNLLNSVDDHKALEIISNLKPKTQIGKELVEAAKRDLGNSYGQRRGGDFGFHFWTRTKGSPKETMRQIREDIVAPLQDMGYDGLRFMDDSHHSVALFEPRPTKSLTANGRRLSPDEIKVLGLPEADLKIQVTKSILENAKKLGMELPPQRIEILVQDVMDQKRMVKLDNELREHLGAIDFDIPLNEQMLENYVGHVPDLKNTMARRDMKGADVDDVIDWTAREADKALASGGLVTNPEKGLTRRREFSRGLTISEANKKAAADPNMAKIMKRAGTNAWFVESSYDASRMNLQARLKAANSKPLLELLEKKGIKWVPSSKNMVIREGKVRKYISGPGSFQVDDKIIPKAGRLADPRDFAKRQWAQEAANKMNYVMSRKEGNFTKMTELYNWVFRKSALAKPGYYLQNWGDALYKNATQYVRVGDYVDANKVWNGKGFVSIAGKMMPAQNLLKEIQDLGVVKFSHTSEAVYGAVAMGKRLTASGSAMPKRGKWQKLNEGIDKMGASGENWSRAALYINRRKQGYSPAQALYDVENIHFNFGRTTRSLDALRTVFPFIQFPIKSLGIARELTVGRPVVSSQFVQLQDKLDKAMNDPMESGFLYRIQKDYQRIQNSIFVGKADKFFNAYNGLIDDILGANSWVAKNLISSSPKFANRVLKAAYPDEVYAGLTRYGIKVKFPVGPDALTPWMMWEDAVQKNGGVLSGPLGEAAMMLITGVDPFTREDLRKGGFSNVLGATMYQVATGAFVAPSTSKVIKQYLNPPDAEFFTPPALLWFKGAFGGQSGFVEIDNVDRMYAFKKRSLMAEYKENVSEYNRLVKREVINGNANLSWTSGIQGTTALEVFRRIQKQLVDAGAVASLGDVYEAKNTPKLIDPMTKKPYPVPDLAEVVADLKGIIDTNKELDANYVFMKKNAVKSRQEEREAMMDKFEIQDGAQPTATEEPEPQEEPESIDIPGDDEQDYETEETD